MHSCCRRVRGLAAATTTRVANAIPQIIKASTTTLVTAQDGARAIYDADELADGLTLSTANNNNNNNSDDDSNSKNIRHVHWIVLVHGWMGNPAEMNTLRASLVEMALPSIQQNKNTAIVVHCATANNGQTHDGIQQGGTRLATEITHWISATINNNNDNDNHHQSSINVTLSLVGNSLGGLYARYALRYLPLSKAASNEDNKSDENDENEASSPACNDESLTTMLQVTPLVFGTTATPHLGVGHAHTYLPLPRFVERGIATVMGTTGADLFRTSTIIDDMTLQADFVQPLQQFQRRLAYANVHGTDFQVPTATAAFLTPDDTTPNTHRIVTPQASYHVNVPQIRLVVQTTTTTSSSSTTATTASFNQSAGSTTEKDDSSLAFVSPVQLAQALDSMGWTKVFCDVRQDLLAVPLPSALLASDSSSKINETQKHSSFSSADLYGAWARWDRDAWHVPVGHTVMVANAKNALYERFNAAGKPVMDALAQDVLSTILPSS